MTIVLVAEDDPDICALIAFKLKQSGYEVLSVNDGFSALDSIRERLPDLVLLDVMMPGMSGIEVCQIVRNDPAMAGLRIIFLTARAQESDVKKGIAAGADDYIIKPFSPRELTSRVSAVLERTNT